VSAGSINLEDVARAIVSENVFQKMEFATVYESVEAADLTPKELAKVFELIGTAVVGLTFVRGEK
jgi:hypothetical protein